MRICFSILFSSSKQKRGRLSGRCATDKNLIPNKQTKSHLKCDVTWHWFRKLYFLKITQVGQLINNFNILTSRKIKWKFYKIKKKLETKTLILLVELSSKLAWRHIIIDENLFFNSLFVFETEIVKRGRLSGRCATDKNLIPNKQTKSHLKCDVTWHWFRKRFF